MTAIEREWLGRIELPPAKTLSVWSLGDQLSPPDAKTKLATTLKAALDGDEKAALQLERAMPFAHKAIRISLTETPHAKGAPRFRTILALFDDVLMSAPVDPARADQP